MRDWDFASGNSAEEAEQEDIDVLLVLRSQSFDSFCALSGVSWLSFGSSPNWRFEKSDATLGGVEGRAALCASLGLVARLLTRSLGGWPLFVVDLALELPDVRPLPQQWRFSFR